MVGKFRAEMTACGEWSHRRLHQVRDGLMEFAREQVISTMMQSRSVTDNVKRLGESVAGGSMTLRDAAAKVAADFLEAACE